MTSYEVHMHPRYSIKLAYDGFERSRKKKKE
jgi:hypothetical protein